MRARVAVVLVLMGLVAALSMAAPGSAGKAVARESLSATGLSIAPQIAYDKAILRVSGPGGFQGRQKFEAGASIQVDLMSFSREKPVSQFQRRKTEAEVAEKAPMPDGRYKFEVAFYANGRKAGVHTGTFFVEGGLAVSREAKRAQLSALRGDLVRGRQSLAAESERLQMSTEGPESPSPQLAAGGYLVVYPTFSPYYTWAALGNYNPVLYSPQAWSMAHAFGSLSFSFGGYPYPFGGIAGYPYTQVTFEPAYYGLYGQGAEIVVGGYIASATLDVQGTYYRYGPRQFEINGWGGYQVSMGVGGSGLGFYDNYGYPIVTFNHGAAPFSLNVNSLGVGIGTLYPYEDLHVLTEDPQILVESNAMTTTGRTLAYMKNNGDVRMFWENTNSGDIWQMSLLSTVLQMATPTGQGKFRVRKNGGLQALTGSTTILDLDSVGNLQVTSVTQTSSREAKEGFEAVNGLSVLEKVAALPITEWSYKADNPNVRHLGPMSEDFHSAFGLGRDDQGLTSVDTSGVALAAIQGLNQKLADKEARIQELVENNAQLEQRLLELEQLVHSLAER